LIVKTDAFSPGDDLEILSHLPEDNRQDAVGMEIHYKFSTGDN